MSLLLWLAHVRSFFCLVVSCNECVTYNHSYQTLGLLQRYNKVNSYRSSWMKWQNVKMTKRQNDKTTEWQNNKMIKQQNNKMAKQQQQKKTTQLNNKMTKQWNNRKNGKMMKWQNDKILKPRAESFIIYENRNLVSLLSWLAHVRSFGRLVISSKDVLWSL